MSDARTEPLTPAPFCSGPFDVRPEWIDENGHVNLAYYVMLFDWATDACWHQLGLGDPFRDKGFGTFAAEVHTLHRAELVVRDAAHVQTQIVASDAKRLHVAHTLIRARDKVVSAHQELVFLCVDLATRRVTMWPNEIAATLRTAVSAAPAWVGRRVAIPSRA